MQYYLKLITENLKIILPLLLIITLGVVLRALNISPFKFYPDAYQNLIVAHNIWAYHSVVGFLGENGMLYPDFFMWTRPVFPLFINLIGTFTKNPEQSAQIVSFLFGILAIPASYFLVKRILESNLAGLIGAFLISFSFSHTVWSGFIMTETTGVFFMLLFLISLFQTLNKKETFINDLLTGFLFATAVLTRYEYAVLIIPLILFLILKRMPYQKLVTITASLLFVLSIAVSQLYPVQSLLKVIVSQTSQLLTRIAFAVLILAGSAFLLQKFKKQNIHIFINTFLIYLIIGFALLLLAQSFFPTINFYINLSAIKKFVQNDILLNISFLIGIIFMLKDKTQSALVYFVLSSIIFLGFIYYHTNPDMERYMTHLVPFVLIPASFGAYQTLIFIKNSSKNPMPLQIPIILSILFLVVFQARLTYFGIRNWSNGAWHKISYLICD